MTRDEFDALIARAAKTRETLDRLSTVPGVTRLMGVKPGLFIAVTPDPSKPGRWRATAVQDGEPVGHVEAEDKRGALVAARDLGAKFKNEDRG